MPKRKPDKNAARQAKWEKENAEIGRHRKMAPLLKAALRAKGCDLQFFELLDPYEAEFAKVVAWGKQEFPALYAVYEVDRKRLDDENGWRRLGLPTDWQRITLIIDDDVGKTYTAPDDAANLRGSTTVLQDRAGTIHYVIEVIKNPEFVLLHRDYRYGLKLSILLHELGHVKDYVNRVNLNLDTRSGDIIEAEVYANQFAIEECYRRGYFAVGDTLLASLGKYRDDDGYRGEVARRLFDRFQKPNFRPWTDYDISN